MRSRQRFLTVVITIAIRISDLGHCQNLEDFKSCLTRSGVDTFAHLVERTVNSNSSVQAQTYTQLNRQWNHCCQEVLTPAAYLVVQSSSDVQAAVKCSRQAGVRIVAKGGGHSFAKYSYGDSNSVIVDLRALDYVHVDAGSQTVTVGAGLLLGPLNYKLYHSDSGGGHHWAIPTGDCQFVGIPFLLGGGHSDYSRLHGMGVDRVLEMKLVDAAGELRTVNNVSNPELYWALRGAGAGSFGIVTEFKLSVYPAPKAVVFGTLVYNLTDFVNGGIFQAWHKLAADGSLPRNVHAYLKMNNHKIHVHLIELLDKNPENGKQDNIGAIMARFPPNHVTVLLRTLPYLEYLCKHGQSSANATGRPENPDDLQYIERNSNGLLGTTVVRSFYVPYDSLITEGPGLPELDALVQDAPDAGFYFQLLGGAINDVGRDDMAFVHRNSAYLAQYGFVIRVDKKTGQVATKLEPAAAEWAERFWQASRRILKHTESYQNYVDPTLVAEEYLERYYGGNLKRLVALKKEVDPENLFHHPQSIPVVY